MQNAECEGSNIINVDEGYWRMSQDSTTIYQCLLKSACLGGFKPENENPVECADGYTGILCHSCIIDENNKYMRSGSNGCGKCPDDTQNAL